MEDLWVMCMIYVGKDTEELAIDVFDGRGKGLGKVMAYDAPGELQLSPGCPNLTRLCGEDVLVIEQVLDPGHDVINICRCGKVNTFAILVDPSVVEAFVNSV